MGWCLLSAFCVGAAETPPARNFRVMSYNIHHGEGMDGRIDLERIAALIKSEKADIVALQEVDKGTERTKQRDVASELAALTGMSFIFSNNYAFQGGQYGNAVLTKFKITGATNLWYRMLAPGEQRGLLQVHMEVQGRPLTFLNTHLDHRGPDQERLLSVSQIQSVVRSLGDVPVILCGDFNDVPNSKTYLALQEFMMDTWHVVGEGKGFTIPVKNPTRRIDYIWTSKGAPFGPVKAWVPVSEASDHLPLVAEFEFKAGNR